MNVQLWNAIIVADVQSCSFNMRTFVFLRRLDTSHLSSVRLAQKDCYSLVHWVGCRAMADMQSVANLHIEAIRICCTHTHAEQQQLQTNITHNKHLCSERLHYFGYDGCRSSRRVANLDNLKSACTPYFILALFRKCPMNTVAELHELRAWDAAHVVDCTYVHKSFKEMCSWFITVSPSFMWCC